MIRSWLPLKTKKYVPKHSSGIGLIPLGNRTRFVDFGNEAVEERNNDKTLMYLR
jgi:hypothetical protein